MGRVLFGYTVVNLGCKVNRVEAVIELNVSPKKSRGFDEIAATIAAMAPTSRRAPHIRGARRSASFLRSFSVVSAGCEVS